MAAETDPILLAAADLLGLADHRLGEPLSGHSGARLCLVHGTAGEPDRVLKVAPVGSGEAAFLTRVAGLLPVATPTVARSAADDRHQVILLDRVEMLEPAADWSLATWQVVVADLARLHQTPVSTWADTGWTPRPAEPLWTPTAAELDQRRRLWQAIAEGSADLTGELVDRLLAQLPRLQQVAADLPTVLVHGDAHRGNLGRVASDQHPQGWRPVWIDWQEAQLGTGAEDLSLLFQRAEHDGSQVPRAELIEQYSQARGLPPAQFDAALIAQEIQLLLFGWPGFILEHPDDPAVARLARLLAELARRWEPLEAAWPGRPGGSAERPAIRFDTADEFEAWLELHHEQADEVWVELRTVSHPDRGLTWEQAVVVGLCFGWIDSITQPVAETVRRQRWTPRRKGSNWSQVNLAHVARLTAEGRMRPAGLAAHQARTTSNPHYSYESDAELDQATAAVVAADPIAEAVWQQVRSGYRIKATHWVMSAKQAATRLRRAEQLRQACAEGVMVKPLASPQTPRWLRDLHAAVLAEHRG